MARVLLIVASVWYAHAHKFLGNDSGDRLVADAAEQKLELNKFFEEATSVGKTLQKELDDEKAKNGQLENRAKQAVGDLKHAKTVFADELHKVEGRVEGKLKSLGDENQNLKDELSRAKLSVVLHEKTEDALRQRLAEIGKVFASQESAVKNIIATSADVESKLKHQDSKDIAKDEEKKDVVVKAEVKAEDVDTKVEDDTKDDAAVVLSKVDADSKDDSSTSADTTEDSSDDTPEEVAAKAEAPEAPEPAPEKATKPHASTSVVLTHKKKAAPTAAPAKADELDLDDSKAKAAAAAVEPAAATSPAPASDMDSISKEVDDLDKEVDAPAPAAASDSSDSPSSSSMLSNAGDALTKLLKQ